MATHFARLNSPEVAGRRTATVGYATAAGYVAQRLEGYGIQPIHPGEYRHLSYGPVNHVSAMAIRLMNADSSLVPLDGQLLPDPRSGAARVLRGYFERVSAHDQQPGAPAGTEAVAVVEGILGDGEVARLRAAGYELAIQLTTPRPGRAPFSGAMGLIQVSSERWQRLLPQGGEQGYLPFQVAIDAVFDPVAPHVSVMGMLPGRHPRLRGRVLVLAANLDSGGRPAGVDIDDQDRSAIGAASLLEVARQLAMEADQGQPLSRSVLFAWFAGGAQGESGLRRFLANPPWPEDAIDMVLLVGGANGAYSGPLSERIVRVGSDRLPAAPVASPLQQAGQDLTAAAYTAAKEWSENDPR